MSNPYSRSLAFTINNISYSMTDSQDAHGSGASFRFAGERVLPHPKWVKHIVENIGSFGLLVPYYLSDSIIRGGMMPYYHKESITTKVNINNHEFSVSRTWSHGLMKEFIMIIDGRPLLPGEFRNEFTQLIGDDARRALSDIYNYEPNFLPALLSKKEGAPSRVKQSSHDTPEP